MVIKTPKEQDIVVDVRQPQRRHPSMWNVEALAYQLANIVGSNKVTSNEADLAAYSFQGTGEPAEGVPNVGIMPDVVVQPTSTKDVQEVVRLANRYVVPVYPVTTGFQSSFPYYGGIVMDLYRMNRIVEVNTDDGYAVIEPGVTYAKLANALRPLGYRFPFGSFPETTSVIGSLMERRALWSTWIQTSGREISNLELVLGNGKLMRTGAGAYPSNKDWAIFSSHAIMPDYTRLFTGNFGALGIATKATVRIWAHNEVHKVVLSGFDDVAAALKCVRELSRAYIIEGNGIYHWGATTFFGSCFGDKETAMEKYETVSKLRTPEVEANAVPIYQKHPDHPYVYCYLIFSGFKGEIEHRIAFAEQHVKKHGGSVYTEVQARKQLGDFGPEIYERWLVRGFQDHYNPNDLMRLKYGGHMIEGRAPFIYIGRPSAIPKMQEEVMRYLWSEGCKWGMFGFKLEDQARNCYFRFGIYLPEERPWQDFAKVRENLTAIGHRYNMHYISAWPAGEKDQALPSMGELTRVIKQYCDPNDILNPWRSYIGGE